MSAVNTNCTVSIAGASLNETSCTANTTSFNLTTTSVSGSDTNCSISMQADPYYNHNPDLEVAFVEVGRYIMNVSWNASDIDGDNVWITIKIVMDGDTVMEFNASNAG